MIGHLAYCDGDGCGHSIRKSASTKILISRIRQFAGGLPKMFLFFSFFAQPQFAGYMQNI